QPKMKVTAQPRKPPQAPPVYRPEPNKIVQPKANTGARRNVSAGVPASTPSRAPHRPPSSQQRPAAPVIKRQEARAATVVQATRGIKSNVDALRRAPVLAFGCTIL